MACIFREWIVEAPVDAVWDAVRDVGAVHQRLVPGVLTDAKLEAGARVVTFANGMVVRELIVDLDDSRRRFCYAAVGGRTSHHNASIQVFAQAENQSRMVWTIDLLPEAMAAPVAALMDLGIAAMTKTLARGPL